MVLHLGQNSTPTIPLFTHLDFRIYQLTSRYSLPTQSRWLPPQWNLLWVCGEKLHQGWINLRLGLTSLQPRCCVKHGPGWQRPFLLRLHLLFFLPAETTPPAIAPTLLGARRENSSHGHTSSYCCQQRPLLLPPPRKRGRCRSAWRRRKRRRRRHGKANRQFAVLYY